MRLRQILPTRARVRRLFANRPEPPWLGEPSRFEPEQWVRVLGAEPIARTLDERGALRGLPFVPQQWWTCGRKFRVLRRIQRILDDRGAMRPIARSVVLDGVGCGGAGGEEGCGRDCPLWFRDEWLEPAEPPAITGTLDGPRVEVRSPEEITATLDRRGRTDGIQFMPEMFRYSGNRYLVHRRATRAYELGRETTVGRRLYMLDGLYCDGDALGARGPCHRSCRLVWHERWVRFL